MNRGPFEVLRRGLDNTAANWGLIVVRLVETLVFAAIAVAAAIAILAPILVSIGIEVHSIDTPEDLEEFLLTLISKWVLLIWIFVAVCVLLLIFVALHSFVEAGCARVYVDGDRIAGPDADRARSRFKVFSVERWYAGGKDGWWSVFWIYNFAWGVAGLIFLIPLVPTLILTLVFREEPPVAIASGCIGLVITIMLMILVSVVTGMWAHRAIADWAVHRTGAAASLATAWQSIKRDLGRHLLVAIAMIVIAIAGSSFFASFSFFAAFGEAIHETAVFNLITLPLRLVGTLLSSIFSAFVSSWYLAAYAALAVEGRR